MSKKAKLIERSEQMNIRLFAEEKALLEAAARKLGYRSISDYVRVIVLKDARTMFE